MSHGIFRYGEWAQLGCTGLVALGHVGSWFPDWGSNLLPLHCKVDSQQVDTQGSPSSKSWTWNVQTGVGSAEQLLSVWLHGGSWSASSFASQKA